MVFRTIFLILLLAISARADRVVILDTPEDRSQARVDLMAGATSHLYMGYFIMRHDFSGLMHLAMLRDAARRNVDTRLVLDALGNLVKPAMLKHLRNEGVLIREFNYGRLMEQNFLAKRYHGKVVAADGRRANAGDANAGDEYLKKHVRPSVSREGRVNPMRSRDIYVEGESVAEIDRYFDELLQSKYLTEPRTNGVTDAEEQAAARELDEVMRHIQVSNGSWAREVFEVDDIRFVYDPVDQKGKVPGVEQEIFALFENARHSIDFMTPYFVLTKRSQRAIEDAVRRGVPVRGLMNSLKSSDNDYLQEVYEWQKPKVARTGIDLSEYQPERTYHIKSVIRDAEETFLGAFNFHPRSEFLDAETGFVLKHRGFAQRCQVLLAEDMRDAIPVMRGGSLIGSPQAIKIPRWKRAAYKAFWKNL